MTRPPRRPSIRPSLVDIGWESVPSVVPNDTVVGGSTESNELTAPIRPSAPNASESPSEYSEPTGNIDDLLADSSDSGLGLPAVGSHRLPPPPSVPRIPAAAPVTPRSAPPPPPRSAPPPPPSSRHMPPPPSSRPRPPSVHPPGPFGATQPLVGAPPRRPFPAPPPMPARIPPPRPHLPSGGPLQDLPDGLPRLDSDDDTLLTELSRPNRAEWDAPPSSGTPSSRLPAGIVIPDEVLAPPAHAAPALSPPSLAFAPTEEIPAVPEPMPVSAVAPPPSRSPASESTQPAARLRAGVAPTIPSAVVPEPNSQLSPPSSRSPFSDAHQTSTPTLGQALVRRVRLGSLVVPLGIPVAAAIFVVAVSFGVIMALITSMSASPQAAVPQASAATESEPAPRAEPSEAPEPAAPRGNTPLERAKSGDQQALNELSARPAAERTIAESVAIAAGNAALEKQELEALGKQAKTAAFAEDAAAIKKLLGFVRQDTTSLRALELIARIDGPLGPDLLYHVWTSTRRKDAATELAEALVMSKEVRPRASPALAVALDLRTVDGCEQTAKVVSRAGEHADRRSLSLLVKLNNKRGCGPKKNQDCYPCLRDGEQLDQAIKAARKRHSPRF